MTSSGSLPVEAQDLFKRYGDLVAVNGISFSIQPGSCVGFLGPNGAGKSSMIKMVTGFTPITSGKIHVFGFDVAEEPRRAKELSGVCPQEDGLDPDFSVEKNLLVYARYFDIPKAEAKIRIEKLLDLMQLSEKRKAAIEELSGGMRRRLVLARSLLNKPRLLVLDEPTTGLDPQARQMMWQRIRQLRAEGVTVLLTTHYMEEAAQLCERVILMDQGKILLEGKPSDLITQEAGREVVELWGVTADIKSYIDKAGWTHEDMEDRIFIYSPEGGQVSEKIGKEFPHQQRLLRHATLEDVFLRKTGRALRE